MEYGERIPIGTIVGGFIFLVLVVWLWRPIHAFAMFFYAFRVSWVFVAILALSVVEYFREKPRDSGTIVIGCLVGLIIAPIISYPISYPITMTAINHHQIQPNIVNIDEIPRFSNDTRAIPMKVAEATFLKALTEPRYTVSSPEITRYNGKDIWISELHPDGLINTFRRDTMGFMVMAFNSTNIKKIKINVKCSPNMEYFDNLYYILEKHIFWADYDNPIPYITSTKHEWVVPIIKYHQHLLYAEPYWAGIATVDMETCKVTYYPVGKIPAEYKQLPIFPESLAKWYADAFAWWKKHSWSNVMNIFFYHENQTEFHDYSQADGMDLGNGQPFFVRTGNGTPKWFIALEPHGRSYGIKKVLMIDQSGKIYVKTFDSPVIGVGAAVTAVKNALPTFDWSQFYITEPIPVQKNDQLYWRLVVIPKDSSTISKIVLIPMKNGAVTASEVKVFNSIPDYARFLNGENFPKPIPAPQNGNTTSSIITGKVLSEIQYEVNGTTHFVVEIQTSNGTKVIDIPASCLTPEEIVKVGTLQNNIGHEVEFEYVDGCWKPKF